MSEGGALDQHEVDDQDSRLKIIIVGDGAVGKTCLLLTYIRKGYPEDYNPTVIDKYNINVKILRKPLSVDLWDTAGQEEFEAIRKLSYPDSHVALICYNTVSKSSLMNVKSVWHPELTGTVKDIPFLLVGTKSDLKAHSPHLAIDDRTVKQMIKTLKPYEWMECSAKLYEDPEAANVDTVFKTAISCVIDRRLNPDQPCCCTIL